MSTGMQFDMARTSRRQAQRKRTTTNRRSTQNRSILYICWLQCYSMHMYNNALEFACIYANVHRYIDKTYRGQVHTSNWNNCIIDWKCPVLIFAFMLFPMRIWNLCIYVIFNANLKYLHVCYFQCEFILYMMKSLHLCYVFNANFKSLHFVIFNAPWTVFSYI